MEDKKITNINFGYIKENYHMNLREISERFDIPYRTVQNWNAGIRECPKYILKMMNEILKNERA